MATYAEMYNMVRESSSLRSRSEMAIADILPDIFWEADTTANHTERVAWSQYASHRLEAVTNQMMPLIVAHDNIDSAGEDVTDANLKSAISSLVDIFAVFYYNNLNAGSSA